MRKTVEVLVSGKVQNIGFRAFVKRTGQNLGLCGVVENLPYGRVRALVTGEDMIIEKFLSMIYTCPRAIIREVAVSEWVMTEFSNFTVRRK